MAKLSCPANLRRALLVAALSVVAAFAPPVPARATPPAEAMAAEINALRAANGVEPLNPSISLERSARGYAGSMMGRDYFAISSASRRAAAFRRFGEVIERHLGSPERVAETVAAWARSPGHRHLLLNPVYRYVGAGRARGRFRGRVTTIWTVHLGGRLHAERRRRTPLD